MNETETRAEYIDPALKAVGWGVKAIFSEEELKEAATCKNYLQVRPESGRGVTRSLHHYHLEAKKTKPFLFPSPACGRG
jgi:hypothetical protein